MPINVTGDLGPDEDGPGFIESPFAIDPGPTKHHLDTGPEHLRSTPNVHEQEEVETSEAEAVGGGRPAREIIIQHLATCALDPRALPAVELACEVRRQLLGKAGEEGLPGWALKLYLMGGPAAAHALPSEHGEALQEVAAVFAEAMQLAVDRVREEAERAGRAKLEDLTHLLNRRAVFPFRIGLRVVTLGGEVGEVVSGRGYADGSEGAVVRFPEPRTSEEATMHYTPTGVPESLAHDPALVHDLFPLVIAYVKET